MKRNKLVSAGLLAALLLFVISGRAGARDCATPAKTAGGPARGEAADNGSCRWLGIPYAAAPVGDSRWRRPRPHPGWDGVLVADKAGDKCLQYGIIDTPGLSRPKGSEDCLYLNVFSPARIGPFPVMVFIHGGGLMSGEGHGGVYQGDVLAGSNDVVVVTFNYRLGVFGFLAHPELAEEDQDGSTGGYGMMDQIAALEWVRDNIAAFGGDPDNVAIFGESAGGWSVCQLVASPRAAGLFHRAIQESGGCNRTLPLSMGYAFSREFAKELGCAGENQADCMRKKSAAEIMSVAPFDAAGMGMPFKVHEDGYLLSKMPIGHIRAGEYNRVPFIAGSNRDEYRLFSIVEPGLPKLTEDEYVERVRAEKGEWAGRFLKAYPAADFGSPYEAYITMAADRNPGCGGYDAVTALASRQKDVYYYRFDFDDIPLSDRLGAFHGLELLFVFGTYDRGVIGKILGPRTAKMAAPLSRVMRDYWTGFARTGDPNHGDLPTWPRYDPENRRRIIFDSDAVIVARERDHYASRCALWEAYVGEVERQGN